MKLLPFVLIISLGANAALLVLWTHARSDPPAPAPLRSTSAGRPGPVLPGAGAVAANEGAAGANPRAGGTAAMAGRLSSGALAGGESAVAPAAVDLARLQGYSGGLQLAAKVADAGAATIGSVFDEIRALPASRLRDELTTQLYRRWGEVAPAEAFAAIANLPGPERQARETDIVRGWALSDPGAALDWIDRNPLPLSSTTTNPRNGPRYQAVADALLAADRPDLAIAALQNVKDDTYRALLAVRVSDYFARYDPGEGANWLLSLPAGAVRNNAAARFARTIAEDGPELGLEVAANLPKNAGRNQAITAVFREWADSGDPARAEAWLATQPPSAVMDNVLLSFLPVAAGKDGDLGTRMLGRFASDENRQKAVDAAAGRIVLEDPARAVDWMLAQGTPNAERLRKLTPLVRAWAKSDPDGAARRLPGLPGLTAEEREALLPVVQPPGKKK